MANKITMDVRILDQKEFKDFLEDLGTFAKTLPSKKKTQLLGTLERNFPPHPHPEIKPQVFAVGQGARPVK